MPRPKSALYDYHYFSKNVDMINIDGIEQEKETVKCNINSCTMTWSKIAPKYVSVSICKSHFHNHHKDEWLQYEQWKQSGGTTAPPSFTSSSLSPSSSSQSSSTSSISTVVNYNGNKSTSHKRQRYIQPIVIDDS